MRKAGACMTVLILAGTPVCIGAEGGNGIEDVRKRATTYYSYEKAKNWDKAYAMRTRQFRASVPFDTYVKIMSKDSRGWQLKEFSVIYVKQEGDRAVLEMRFVETPPADFIANTVPKEQEWNRKLREMTFTEKSTWLSEGGAWYCYEAGSRMHLSLNHAVAAE